MSSEIFGFAECEIICSVNCEISHAAFGSVRCEMKFASSRAKRISHAKHISRSEGVFHSPKANFTEKSHSLSRMAFFLCCHYKIDPYKAIVQKQSAFFAVRADLSLGDDGLRKSPEKEIFQLCW